MKIINQLKDLKFTSKFLISKHRNALLFSIISKFTKKQGFVFLICNKSITTVTDYRNSNICLNNQLIQFNFIQSEKKIVEIKVEIICQLIYTGTFVDQ